MEYMLLKEVCSIAKGKQINGEELLQQGVPFYNGGINPSGFWKESNVSANSISISEGGNSCGYVNFQNEPFWCGAHCYYLYNLKINTKYLFYNLKGLQNELMALRTGVCMPNIKKTDLENFKITVVNSNVQQEIVSILDKINAIIDADKKQLELLDETVKSRFIEMFGDPILNDKDWQIKDLNEITDVRDGTHDSPKYYDDGYPFVTSKNLVNGKIDFSSCQLICEEDYLHFNERSCVDDGDILMPMIGTIGGAIIVKKDRDFAIKNVALIKFNKDNSIINRTFILNILNSDSMNEYFNNVKKGGTQNFISLGLIRKIPTVVPPIELQNEFDSFVEQIDQTKSSIQQHLTLMQELLDKKMEEFFGGK